MRDNIHTFTEFEPLREAERAVIDEVTKIMLDTPQIGCTACKYCCDGCPKKQHFGCIPHSQYDAFVQRGIPAKELL